MEYDWVLLNVANPDVNGVQFRAMSDMTTSNTLFMPLDYYTLLPKIRNNPLFQDVNGLFDEKAFTNYYYSIIPKWNDFANNLIVDDFEYEYRDTKRPQGALIRDHDFTIDTFANPNQLKIGVSGFNLVTSSGLSVRELALQSEIVDGKTGKGTGHTVNDLSAFGHFRNFIVSLFDDPIVYATYPEDTFELDPFTGNYRLHFKGEYKLNADGNYYTETLAGRDLLGKEVVSAFDYLTVDTDKINKYDFFDGDGLDKSIGGTILRSVASVAPLAIPGLAANAYSTILLGKALVDIAPMLYGVFTGFFTEDTSNKTLDTWSAYGKRLTLSLSDYDRMNTFTWNNIANMAGDLATIFAALGAVVKAITNLRGDTNMVMQGAYNNAFREYRESLVRGARAVSRKEITSKSYVANAGGDINEINKRIANGTWTNTVYGKSALNKFVPDALKRIANILKWGQNASLVYFAMILNTGLYDELRLNGVNAREASIMTLGSIIGTFSVDKYLHLGLMFFLRTELEAATLAMARASAGRLVKRLLGKPLETSTRKGIFDVLLRGARYGNSVTRNFWQGLQDRTLSTFGKAIGEGGMRMSEEAILDLTKWLAGLAGEFGIFERTDYGAFDNLAERYTMTFLTGAIGGVAFDVAGKIKNIIKGTKKTDNKMQNLINDMVYLVRLGRKGDLLKEYKRMYDSGLFGSKLLSLEKTPDSDEANPTYMPAHRIEDSQAYKIYTDLVKEVDQIEAVLELFDMNINDLESFEKLVHLNAIDMRLRDLIVKDKKAALEASYMTTWHDSVLQLATIIAENERSFELLSKASDATKTTKEWKDQYEALKKDREDLQWLHDYLFGEGSIGYIEELVWALTSDNVEKTFALWLRSESGKSIDELTDAEMTTYNEKYQRYMSNIKSTLHQSFLEFKRSGKTLMPKVKELGDITLDAKRQKAVDDAIEGFVNINENNWLEGETDEEYQHRNKPYEGETDLSFTTRLAERKRKIREYNNNLFKRFLETVSKLKLSRAEQRRVMYKLRTSKLQYLNQCLRELINNSLGVMNTEGTGYNNEELLLAVYNILKDHEIGKPYTIRQIRDLYDLLRDNEEAKLKNKYGDPKATINNWDNAINTLVFELLEKDPRYNLNMNITLADAYRAYRLIRGKKKGKNVLVSKDNDIETNRENVENIMNVFSVDGFAMPFDNTPNGRMNILARDFIVDVMLSGGNASRLLKDERASLIVFQSNENFINEFSERARSEAKRGSDLLKQYHDEMSHDEIALQLDNIESLMFVNSPIIDLLHSITSTYKNIEQGIDDFLAAIYKLYNGLDDKTQFELSDEQLLRIGQYMDTLDAFMAFVNAAREPSKSGGEPIGFNYIINDYIENHHDTYPNAKKLDTIPYDVWAYITHDINQYILELTNWVTASQLNLINIRTKVILSSIAVTNTHNEFWKANSSAMKFTIKVTDKNNLKVDKTIDLLDGIEDLLLDNSTLSDPKALRNLENLVYKNYLNAVSENGDIFVQMLNAMLLPGEGNTMLIKDIKNLADAKISEINENYSYAGLSDYDKIMYLMTVIGVNSVDYYQSVISFIRKTNSQFIPFAPLLYCARMQRMQMRNHTMTNAFLDFVLKNITGTFQLPIIKNSLIANGLAGTGKSAVVAGMNIEEGMHVWVVGPLLELASALKETVSKLVGETGKVTMFTRDGDAETNTPSLIETIIPTKDYSRALLAITKDGGASLSDKLSDMFTISNKGIDANDTAELNDNFIKKEIASKIPKGIDAPDLIIVDEATWFSTLEILALGEFANKLSTNKRPVNNMFLGDSYLNGIGCTVKDLRDCIGNMDYERSLAIRAPRLTLSFRSENIQKVNNTNAILKIINMIESTKSPQERETIYELVFDAVKHLSLSYYHNGNLFFGDRIVRQFDQGMLSILKDKNVGYVGDAVSDSFKALNGIVEKAHSPLSILGLEYDYMVIDKSWNLNSVKNVDNKSNAVLYMHDLLLDIYTMITRARSGCIVIDNGLSEFMNTDGTIDQTTGILTGMQMVALALSEDFARIYSDLAITSASDQETHPLPVLTSNLAAPLGLDTPVAQLDKNKELIEKIFNTPASESDNEKQVPERPANDNTSASNVQGLPDTPVGEETAGKLNFANLLDFSAILLLDEDYSYDAENATRAYTNLLLSGCAIYRNGSWHRINDNTDLNIFMPTQSIRSPRHLLETLTRFMKLKCAMVYHDEGLINYYLQLDRETQKMFPQESLLNITWIIRSRLESNRNSIVGRPDIDNSKRAIGSDATGKRVISLVAQINGKDLNGNDKVYYITMGMLANPETWMTPAKRQRIIEALLRRIESGTLSEAESRSKLQYMELLADKTIIDEYEHFINKLASEDIDIVLDGVVPNRSTLTAFIDKQANAIRMENINNTETPYADMTPFTVNSGIFVITDPVELGLRTEPLGQNERDPFIGAPAMFVSANCLLAPSELKRMYILQKYNLQRGIPCIEQVRLVLLNKVGVPIKALIDSITREKFFLHQEANGTRFDVYTPMEADAAGVRIYMSMWNFRAALRRFNDQLGRWMTIHNLSDEDVTTICKLENRVFKAMQDDFLKNNPGRRLTEYDISNELKKGRTLREPYLTEDEYELLKLLWEFNNGENWLASNTKFFRLGNSTNFNGAYIRQLVGIDRSPLYAKFRNRRNARHAKGQFDPLKDQVYGVYIDPKLAKNYLDVMDAVFTNVVDLIIKPPRDPLTDELLYADDYINENLAQNWFSNLRKAAGLLENSMEFEIVNYLTNEDGTTLRVVSTIPMSSDVAFGLLFESILMLIQNNDLTMAHKATTKTSKIRIKGGKIGNENDILINWRAVLGALSQDGRSGFIPPDFNTQRTKESYTIPGVCPYRIENGDTYIGMIDRRIEHMFNLMFHGVTTTSRTNEILGDTPLATDANFKYGFFADPVFVSQKVTGGGNNEAVPVATNQCMFSSDVLPSLPIYTLPRNILRYFLATDLSIPLSERRSRREPIVITYREEPVREVQSTLPLVMNEEAPVMSDFAEKLTKTIAKYDIGYDINDGIALGRAISDIDSIMKENFTNAIKESEFRNLSNLPIGLTYENGEFNVLTIANTYGRISGKPIRHADGNGVDITTTSGRRFNIDVSDGVDITPISDENMHENALRNQLEAELNSNIAILWDASVVKNKIREVLNYPEWGLNELNKNAANSVLDEYTNNKVSNDQARLLKEDIIKVLNVTQDMADLIKDEIDTKVNDGCSE